MAWVVFAHGTAFYTNATPELPADSSLAAIADAARGALRELGPVRAGSSSADFNPVRLDGWFPDEPVWLVSFDHPAIGTVVVAEGTALGVGMFGRSQRQLDHDEQSILVVRGFDGAIERGTPT